MLADFSKNNFCLNIFLFNLNFIFEKVFSENYFIKIILLAGFWRKITFWNFGGCRGIWPRCCREFWLARSLVLCDYYASLVGFFSAAAGVCGYFPVIIIVIMSLFLYGEALPWAREGYRFRTCGKIRQSWHSPVCSNSRASTARRVRNVNTVATMSPNITSFIVITYW